MEKENQENACRISRWQLLKAQLNNLDPIEFKEILEKEKTTLIDVRTAKEFSKGSLQGAVNIDYLAYDFWDKIETLDPEETHLIFCRSGRRSIRTCTLMKNGGFKKVFNMEGGLIAWEKAMGEAIMVSED